jgi:predicted Zn-dependent protease
MTFNGKYFDGKSSTGYKATVTLDTYHITIVYSDAPGNQKEVKWNTDLIHKNDFSEQNSVHLKYGDFPHQYLEFEDKSIEAALKTMYPNAAFHKTVYNRMFSTGIAGLTVMILATLGFIALCYFVILPSAAESLATQLPISFETQLGDAAFKNMTQYEQTNDSCSALMNRFFKELNYKTKYPVQITVVNSNVVNAYALPGGHIVVYTGIIEKMDNADELVALLSHEFSHVQLKHSTKNICRSLSSYLLLSLIVGDAGGVTAVVLQNADQLKQLGYSRSLEAEADREGMKLMEQNQIDLEGMRGLFKALKEDEHGADIPAFLSTHPLTDDRIKAVTAQIQKHTFNPQPHTELDQLWLQIKQTTEE